MSGAPSISVRDVSKTYRLGRVDVPVLRRLSLDVGPGERVAVLGASGSGKSTLLHLIAGLDRPDRDPPGTIRVGGLDIGAASARERNVLRRERLGFVFQFYHLFAELTIVENVMLAALVRGGGSARSRATELLGRVGLGHRLAHRPVELSGGERQRVAIARALINEPTVLLADEPTGNLDRRTGDAILGLILDLQREPRRTLVVVTHDPHVAASCDRIVTLEDGRVASEPGGGRAAPAAVPCPG